MLKASSWQLQPSGSGGCGNCARRQDLPPSQLRRRAFTARRPARHVPHAAGSGGSGFGVSTSTRESAGRKAADTEAAEAFLSWAHSAGIQFPKLKVANFDGVRGMAARTIINSGDTLVSLPREAALLATPGQRCPFPDWVDAAFWDSQPWFVRLALMLLHERSLGSTSRVAGYVVQLPREFDTPLHWSPEERSALAYPHLIAEVEQQERLWAQLHADLTAASPGCSVTLTDLTWALECVFSRAFSGPYSGSTLKQKGLVAGLLAVLGTASLATHTASLESVLNAGIAAVLFNIIYDSLLGAKLKWHALVPVIDSMNHASSSKSEVAFEYFRDRFVAEAGDPVAAGSQAFITYGRQGSDRLLQYYGFVEGSNPNDTYVLRDLDTAIEAVVGQPVSGNAAALQVAGLTEALTKASFSRGGPEAGTLAAARAALAAPGAGTDFKQPQDPRAELLAHQVLVKALEAEQQRLAAAEQPAAHPRGSLVRAFRAEKAAVLAAAIDATRQRARALQRV